MVPYYIMYYYIIKKIIRIGRYAEVSKYPMKTTVHCATRGENELFLARVRCSARVRVTGTEGATDGEKC